MKLSVSLLALLVLQTNVAIAHSLELYKSCMYECFNCVTTWGKEIFNGQRCVDDCATSEGTSIDLSCKPYFFGFDGATQGLVSKGNKRFGNTGMAVNIKELDPSPAFKGSDEEKAGWAYTPYRLSFSPVSTLSRVCQHLCRACEPHFTSGMDAHACMYNCATTKGQMIRC